MKNQAVIFDMDGVICHTNPFHSKAFRVFFGKRGLDPTEEEFEKHMYGKSNKYIFNHFLGREISGTEFNNLENEKEGLFREIYADQIVTLPAFLPFLNELKNVGFRTGVATSAPRANLDLIMGALKFAPKMESILASENVKNHKPDPEVYLTSAKLLDVNPANCLVFEDSYSGVSAAINAGMQVVGVLSSHTKEDLPPCQLYINDYSEIDIQTVEKLLQ
ncbi:HAD family phosphatase [uncultured Cyclobacterium sp.]|uniref:HAD family hydrolase n=1 Tax=uncultured Cyclobacterium sp. TaxID=453820 RepID=UPI0030EB1593|tara:strand:- start:202186 stop:202842 length:657 start_codon:yes stop_codon:yes gene_type:complete